MSALGEEIYLRALRRLGWNCERLVVAVSFRDRLFGMTVRQGRAGRFYIKPRAPSASDAGLVMAFPACASLHTLGMRFPLDIAFIDGAGAVLALHENVPPASICNCRGAFAALERFSALEDRQPDRAAPGCTNMGRFRLANNPFQPLSTHQCSSRAWH